MLWYRMVMSDVSRPEVFIQQSITILTSNTDPECCSIHRDDSLMSLPCGSPRFHCMTSYDRNTVATQKRFHIRFRNIFHYIIHTIDRFSNIRSGSRDFTVSCVLPTDNSNRLSTCRPLLLLLLLSSMLLMIAVTTNVIIASRGSRRR